MSAVELAWLGAAALAGGAINAVAGGGSLLTFPALLAFGVPPVVASATNSVAMAPGSLAAAIGYRHALGDNARSALLLSAAAAVGSVVGAVLLLGSSERVFTWLVPLMVLLATATLLFQGRVQRWAGAGEIRPSRARTLGVAALLALAAVYGGYFGAGIGIVTLGLLGLLRSMSIHRMNAVKSLVVGCINGIAAAYFLIRGVAELPTAGVMGACAVLGGYGGARLAQLVSPERVRVVVVLVGVGLTLALAARYWL
jgi:hypothetical protein